MTTPRFLALAALAVSLAGCEVLQLGQPIRPAPGDWTALGGDPGHTFLVATGGPTPPLRLSWTYTAPAMTGRGSPIIVDDLVFVGTMQGEVHVVRLKDGEGVGYRKFGRSVESSPALSGSFLLIPNSEEGRASTLTGYDVTEGRQLFKLDIGAVESTPLIVGQRGYVTTLEGELVAVDLPGGAVAWKAKLPGPTHASPSAAAGLIVCATDAGIALAFDLETGKERWRHALDGPTRATPTVGGGAIYIGTERGTMHALSLVDGTEQWRAALKKPIPAQASLDTTVNRLYVGTSDGRFRALNTTSGDVLWTWTAKGPIVAPAAVVGDWVYVGSLSKQFVALSATTGVVGWETELKGRVKTAPAVARGTVVIASEDKYVYGFTMDGPAASR